MLHSHICQSVTLFLNNMYVILITLTKESKTKIDTNTSVLHRSSKSQVYLLMFGSQKIPVYCHMGNFGCGDGGWTLAMKIDGKKVCSFTLSEFINS